MRADHRTTRPNEVLPFRIVGVSREKGDGTYEVSLEVLQGYSSEEDADVPALPTSAPPP